MPNDMETRLHRAVVYTELKDFDAALADLKYGLEHGFSDPYMYLNLDMFTIKKPK
jgi:hypothetical protein